MEQKEEVYKLYIKKEKKKENIYIFLRMHRQQKWPGAPFWYIFVPSNLFYSIQRKKIRLYPKGQKNRGPEQPAYQYITISSCNKNFSRFFFLKIGYLFLDDE